MKIQDYRLLIWKKLEYKDVYVEELSFEEGERLEDDFQFLLGHDTQPCKCGWPPLPVVVPVLDPRDLLIRDDQAPGQPQCPRKLLRFQPRHAYLVPDGHRRSLERNNV